MSTKVHTDHETVVKPLNEESKGEDKNVPIANERLEELLGYGKYQKFQVYIFLGLMSFYGAMDYYHAFLLVMKPEHRCNLPESIQTR